MARSQAKSRKKNSGGILRGIRPKRAYELASQMIEVKPGERKVRAVRVMGGNIKMRAIKLQEANILNPKTRKTEKSEIIAVKENQANVHFVRRNTITKGAIIETKAGLAKVTNRPGQEGTVNAVLVEN